VNEAIKIIKQFREMSDDEFVNASQINFVCFHTASNFCKNPECPKKYCRRDYYKIKEVILGSHVGITKFANFMGFDSLEKVADHFDVEPDDVPTLDKHIA
jgi:hypothetical protein